MILWTNLDYLKSIEDVRSYAAFDLQNAGKCIEMYKVSYLIQGMFSIQDEETQMRQMKNHSFTTSTI